MQPARGIPGLQDLLAGSQIRGTRPYQEDEFRITAFRDQDPDGCDLLMVLADGMGGHRGGAEASRVAVMDFVEVFDSAEGGVTARLRRSLDAANAAVAARAAENSRLRGMGCTLVACVVTDREDVHWISVGDSPLWRVRVGESGNAELDRLNADHSMKPVLAELVRQGQLTSEEARHGSHQLRSAVIGADMPLIDEGRLEVGLKPGEMLVLASDGVETLSDEEIGQRCTRPNGASVADIVFDVLRAVEVAALPSQDNATVLMYRHVRRGAVRQLFARLTAPTRPLARARCPREAEVVNE